MLQKSILFKPLQWPDTIDKKGRLAITYFKEKKGTTGLSKIKKKYLIQSSIVFSRTREIEFASPSKNSNKHS
jgi:hypothetical protein